MISHLWHRLFSKKTSCEGKEQVIPLAAHGIRRESLSDASYRTVEVLQQQGFHAFIVGGAVRDLIAGVPPKDFDVATDATPEQVRRCFRRAHIIGRRFRIVHVYHGREIVEVATFRSDHETHGMTDEHGRILRDNVFGTQAQDAVRRDFTVNALYYDPVAQTVHDYHHGVADLKRKILRMIGDPVQRYREDPVRMLRAIRLATRLDLTIEPRTLQPIREMHGLLKHVPVARLFDEMLKLLLGGAAVRAVHQLRAEGLHRGLLPLLDVILAEPQGERLVLLALQKTDDRVLERKPVSPSFLFATLLWHEVASQWQHLQAQGEHTIPALYTAMNHVLERQHEQLAITRRIASDMKEIWAMQPRFTSRVGKKPGSLLAHPRFRAGYDFLLLRAEATDDGELNELAKWWTRFVEADPETRSQLLLPVAAKKKRRRRSKTRQQKSPENGS